MGGNYVQVGLSGPEGWVQPADAAFKKEMEAYRKKIEKLAQNPASLDAGFCGLTSPTCWTTLRRRFKSTDAVVPKAEDYTAFIEANRPEPDDELMLRLHAWWMMADDRRHPEPPLFQAQAVRLLMYASYLNQSADSPESPVAVNLGIQMSAKRQQQERKTILRLLKKRRKTSPTARRPLRAEESENLRRMVRLLEQRKDACGAPYLIEILRQLGRFEDASAHFASMENPTSNVWGMSLQELLDRREPFLAELPILN